MLGIVIGVYLLVMGTIVLGTLEEVKVEKMKLSEGINSVVVLGLLLGLFTVYIYGDIKGSIDNYTKDRESKTRVTVINKPSIQDTR